MPKRPDPPATRADQDVLRQVKDALTEGGMALVEDKARELMAVHNEPGYLNLAYLTAWESLLTALQYLGQHAEAAEGFSALADAEASVYGDTDSRAIKWRDDGGMEFALLGRYDQAAAVHRYVLALAAKARPRRHRAQLYMSAVNGLVFVHNMRGEYAEAESVARAAIRQAEKSFGVPRSNFVVLHCSLGKSLNGQGRHAEAERTMEYFPRSLGVLLTLTAARTGLGRLDEAETDAREAVARTEKHFGPAHHVRLDAALQLGIALARQGKDDEAGPLLEANAQAWTEHFGDQHPKTIAALDALAEISDQPGGACWPGAITTPRPPWRPARSSRNGPCGPLRRPAPRPRPPPRSGRRAVHAVCQRARRAGWYR
jgi:tetratricopeptide (TPR) repeat protein